MSDDNDHARSRRFSTAHDQKEAPYPEVDDTVLRRCIEGDREALQIFARTYHGAVRRFLARVLVPRPSAPDLDDLVQEVFTRVTRGIAGFTPSPEARVSTWLLTIAFNVARDLHRKNRVASRVDPSDYARFERSRTAAAGSPEDALDRKRRGEEIESALARLPEEQRKAFVLFYYEGRSCEEIAEICGASAGNIKTRLHRARKHMQAHVKGDFK